MNIVTDRYSYIYLPATPVTNERRLPLYETHSLSIIGYYCRWEKGITSNATKPNTSFNVTIRITLPRFVNGEGEWSPSSGRHCESLETNHFDKSAYVYRYIKKIVIIIWCKCNLDIWNNVELVNYRLIIYFIITNIPLCINLFKIQRFVMEDASPLVDPSGSGSNLCQRKKNRIFYQCDSHDRIRVKLNLFQLLRCIRARVFLCNHYRGKSTATMRAGCYDKLRLWYWLMPWKSTLHRVRCYCNPTKIGNWPLVLWVNHGHHLRVRRVECGWGRYLVFAQTWCCVMSRWWSAKNTRSTFINNYGWAFRWTKLIPAALDIDDSPFKIIRNICTDHHLTGTNSPCAGWTDDHKNIPYHYIYPDIVQNTWARKKRPWCLSNWMRECDSDGWRDRNDNHWHHIRLCTVRS